VARLFDSARREQEKAAGRSGKIVEWLRAQTHIQIVTD
jgi:hypothetical protein